LWLDLCRSVVYIVSVRMVRALVNRLGFDMRARVHVVGTDGELIPICPIHWDASRMNKHDECDECLDDAHEAEIMCRVVTR
jgi:hypothetical protein